MTSPEELDQRITDAIAHATRELRDEFRTQLHEIRGGDSRSLVDGMRRIDQAGSQSGVLTALLEATEPYSQAATLLLRTEEGLRGWGARGLDGSGDIEAVAFPIGSAGPWAEVVGGDGVVHGSARELHDSVGSAGSESSTFVPLVLRGQVAGVLASDGVGDVSALQALTYSASQAIETLGVRQGQPSATLRASAAAAAVAPAPMPMPEPQPEPAPEPTPAFEPTPEPIVEVVETAPASDYETVAEPVEEIAPPVEPPPVEAPPVSPLDELDPMRTVAIPQPVAPVSSEATVVAPTPEVEAPAEVVPPVAPGGDSPKVAPDGQILPPEDLEGPGWAFTATRTPVETGDDEMHEEARRLARLLVSEIKLYNEEQVEEGRQARNIYARLKEDIDRSRQIFEERINEQIRGKTDYFHEELVRILASGDPSILGLEH